MTDTMTIDTPIAGAQAQATVTVIDNVGAEEESDEDYRVRVLSAIRTVGGGGNSADYRSWSEEVAGVRRAYPYAGQPGGGGDPADRTVYVEATTDIDPDGIPPSSLLDEVRDSITTDPVTGKDRQPLGLNDSTLYVEAITRTEFYVVVTNLIVSADDEVQAKSDITDAVAAYFLALFPFVQGLDFIGDKNDIVTDVSISEVVQDVMNTYGGSAEDVSFNIGGGALASYTLDMGELAKSGGVSFVTV